MFTMSYPQAYKSDGPDRSALGEVRCLAMLSRHNDVIARVDGLLRDPVAAGAATGELRRVGVMAGLCAGDWDVVGRILPDRATEPELLLGAAVVAFRGERFDETTRLIDQVSTRANKHIHENT